MYKNDIKAIGIIKFIFGKIGGENNKQNINITIKNLSFATLKKYDNL